MVVSNREMGAQTEMKWQKNVRERERERRNAK